MTGYLTYDAPVSHTSVRPAVPADQPALEDLAGLDSARPLEGNILIAEVNGEPQAAIEITSGTAVANPFQPTAHLVERLTAHASSLNARRPTRRLSLRTRPATA